MAGRRRRDHPGRRGERRRAGLSVAALLVVPVLTLSACTGGSGSSVPAASEGSAATTAPSASSTAASSPAASTPSAPAGSASAESATCDTPAPQVLDEIEPSVVTVRTPIGLGSGIVFKPDIIITDQHVVARREGKPAMFDTVQIQFADGSTSTGTVVGGDLDTDIAVIRTQRKHLPPLPFEINPPKQGQTVLAVGSPLGLSNTATRGIVSALGRDLPAHGDRTPLVNLIQTDAAISPGNSGGALLDLCGRVVGVNEAYIPPAAGAVSIGFATPSAVAVNVARQLLSTGTVQRPVIGVAGRTLTPQIRQELGVHADHGFVVLQVTAGGPAATAGVRPGDIITSFDGDRISGYADLLGAVQKAKPGQAATITVSRDGHAKKLTITVGSRESH